MKKTERKALKAKLYTAIEKVLKEHKAEAQKKTEKTVKKAIRKIVKNTDSIKKTLRSKAEGIKKVV